MGGGIIPKPAVYARTAPHEQHVQGARVGRVPDGVVVRPERGRGRRRRAARHAAAVEVSVELSIEKSVET